MMKCDKCGKDAVTFIKYAGIALCKEHFLQFIDRKIKREFREQVRFKKDDRVVIAVSGGKDSMLVLHEMHRIFGNWKNFEMIAVTVDEGVANEREQAIKIASEYSKKLGIEYRVIHFSDFIGVRLEDVVSKDHEIKPCTYCGVWRRKVLNEFARSINANYLVLGTNLDDVAQSIIMNVTRGDTARLLRLAPHKKIRKSFIPRIIPLRRVLEKEVKLYVTLAEIPHYSKRCPYAVHDIRNKYREFLNDLEKTDPSVKFAVVNFYDEIKPLLEKEYGHMEMNACKICGEPTPGTICKSCQLLERYRTLALKNTESRYS